VLGRLHLDGNDATYKVHQQIELLATKAPKSFMQYFLVCIYCVKLMVPFNKFLSIQAYIQDFAVSHNLNSLDSVVCVCVNVRRKR
jgi:hypothetical protein